MKLKNTGQYYIGNTPYLLGPSVNGEWFNTGQMDEKYRNLIKEHVNTLVEGTNDSALEKILQIFEERKILNNWMLQKIRNNNNKQKTFYEMIPKRGPTAFSELLSALSKAGLGNLKGILDSHRVLHPCDNQDINYNGDKIDGNCLSMGKNEDSENNLEESNENQFPMENYVVKSSPRGVMLIINNREFPYKRGSEDYERRGSEKDVTRLKEAGEAFDFYVKIKQNLSSEKLKEYINIFVQKNILYKVDCAIIIFMSHGKKLEDTGRQIELECPDNMYVKSSWLLQQFDAIHCPALAGKPKGVFFVACRGENIDTGLYIATDNSRSSLSNVQIVPKCADLLVVYSTSPGYLSFRYPDGTPFIKSFCEVLARKTNTSLQEVIDEVSRIMKTKLPIQIIHWESFGFDKKFPLVRK